MGLSTNIKIGANRQTVAAAHRIRDAGETYIRAHAAASAARASPRLRIELTAVKADTGSVKLPAEIGRPALTETYELHAVNGSFVIGPLLPVFWFIDPASGAVQFCAVRHAGLCVQMSLP